MFFSKQYNNMFLNVSTFEIDRIIEIIIDVTVACKKANRKIKERRVYMEDFNNKQDMLMSFNNVKLNAYMNKHIMQFDRADFTLSIAIEGNGDECLKMDVKPINVSFFSSENAQHENFVFVKKFNMKIDTKEKEIISKLLSSELLLRRHFVHNLRSPHVRHVGIR